MRSKRVPDRVHVVRPPENDGHVRQDGRTIEIVRMLAQISDKLKRSEAERYELLGELREYRKSLRDLEDKADHSEKAYLAIENRLKTKGSVDTESLQRQAKFEKSLKMTEEKMVKAIAGQALIDKRLSDTEDKQVVIDQRLDQSVGEQTKIDRQLEISSQDKSRLVRKVERLEEIVTETQDTLRAKAMVLLTDQSASAQGALKAPAWGSNASIQDQVDQPWWQRALTMQTIGMTSMIVAALLGGWTINQMQQPQVPQIAMLENGGLARLNLEDNRWESVAGNGALLPSAKLSDVTDLEKQKLTERLGGQETAGITANIQNATITPDETPENVLDYSDDQLLAALNNDADNLASKLNDIEPSAVPSVADTKKEEKPVAVKGTKSPILEPKITPSMKNFEKLAYVQDPKVKKAVLAEKDTAPLVDRLKPDSSLPDAAKDTEAQAFQGNPEAQHDIGFIYTAGIGGVDQNFDRAGFWFRESADAGVARAQFNLGALYQQGLGKKRDLKRALYWYREAAKLGNSAAQYNLGIAYIEAIGTNYDPHLAAAFFERAANNGDIEAGYHLGTIYEGGLLGEVKLDEALLWYKISADQGVIHAQTAIEKLIKKLQIDMNDVNNLVERMQQINQSVKGRRAGPESLSAVGAQASSVNSKTMMIAQIQEYLMLTGAYVGPADGVHGSQTEKAIKTYQAANNLPVDGKISSDLLNSMVGGAIEKLNR